MVALALAAALKAGLLLLEVVPFNSDEAVVALMARHILRGDRPLFFYGQAYLGSLDAWLIAGAFLILGQKVFAIRVVQGLLYLGTVATAYGLGLRLFRDRWTATAAALLLAIPPVLVTLYTTATLGGYGETLLIGNLLLLWAIRLRERQVRWLEWFGFGLLAGVGFWAFGLLAVYLLPVGIALIWPSGPAGDARPGQPLSGSAASMAGAAGRYAGALVGFALGSSPWWWATASGGLATVAELGGSHMAGPGGALGLLATLGLRLFNLVVLGLPVIVGLRPPWAVRWLALPLAPLAVGLLIAAAGRAVKLSLTNWRARLLLGVCLTLIAGYLITPFGNDPSGRYFLPLAALLPLFTAEVLQRVRREAPRLAVGLLGGMLIFNLWGNLDAAYTFPPGVTTQFDAVAQVDQRDLPAVMEFLIARGETRGYSNYWVTFPMAFLSGEQLIYSAALPYHLDFSYTVRDDRYGPYREAVAASERAAYVTTNHPPLDERLRAELTALGVTFREKRFGDYNIFYDLSRKVTPQEMGLGKSSDGIQR